MQLWLGLSEWLLWETAWAKGTSAHLADRSLNPADHILGFAICYLLPTAAIAWHEKLLSKQFAAAQKPEGLEAVADGSLGGSGLGAGPSKPQGFAGRGPGRKYLSRASSSSSNDLYADNGISQSGAGVAGVAASFTSALNTELTPPQLVDWCHEQLEEEEQQQLPMPDQQLRSKPKFVYTRPRQHLTHRKVAIKVGASC
jgi:hypothetical protein